MKLELEMGMEKIKLWNRGHLYIFVSSAAQLHLQVSQAPGC